MSRCGWVLRSGALVVLLFAGDREIAEASALWASSGPTSLFRINTLTGANEAAAPISGATSSWSDLAGERSSQGALVWGVGVAAGNPLMALSPITEHLKSSVPITASELIRSLAIDPSSGEFYGASSSSLYRIASATGVATLVGATALGVDQALGFDGAGNLYGIANFNQLVAVNKATGATSLVATLGVPNMADIAVQPETGIMYGIGNIPDYSLYQIDLSDGALVKVGASLGRPLGLAFAAVPEPNGTVLAMFALAMAVCLARRCPIREAADWRSN